MGKYFDNLLAMVTAFETAISANHPEECFQDIVLITHRMMSDKQGGKLNVHVKTSEYVNAL